MRRTNLVGVSGVSVVSGVGCRRATDEPEAEHPAGRGDGEFEVVGFRLRDVGCRPIIGEPGFQNCMERRPPQLGGPCKQRGCRRAACSASAVRSGRPASYTSGRDRRSVPRIGRHLAMAWSLSWPVLCILSIRAIARLKSRGPVAVRRTLSDTAARIFCIVAWRSGGTAVSRRARTVSVAFEIRSCRSWGGISRRTPRFSASRLSVSARLANVT